MTGQLVVITCGKAKRSCPSRAANPYTGGYFAQQWAWARSVAPASRIRILSAKYGLLAPTDLVSPYNLKMGQPGSVTAARIATQLPPGVHVVSTAGTAYQKPLRAAVAAVGGTVEFPFDDVGRMAYKMQAMKRAHRTIPSRKEPR